MTEDLVQKALTALKQKKFAEAKAAMDAFATEYELNVQHFLIKGIAEMSLEDWPAALETFEIASKAFPHQPQVWLNLGVIQENMGHINEAADSLEHSLSLQAQQSDVCGNLSNVYRKQGRFEEAEKMAHRAYELGAPKAQSLNVLGLALAKQGKFENAEKTFKEALHLDPNNPQIHANLANLDVDQMKFEAAWPQFAAARAFGDLPIIRRDEGMARLLAGDYDRGWRLYEGRLELGSALRVRPTCPRHNGEPLSGKRLMLVAEQGLGDTIMFCRYGKILAEAGAELIWVVQNPLKQILNDSLPGTVLSEGNDSLPLADYWLPIMSLPFVTGKYRPSDAPGTPYLRARAEVKLPGAKPDIKKIGLVWAGSPTHERDHERSLLLLEFEPLFAAVKAQYYAPFTGAGLEEIKEGTPVISLEKHINDFTDTAAFLQQMDCLVTVDTAAAHLAGALGIRTFLLLQHCPDWRWGTSGMTTHWYSSVTLLRQPSYGDWESVIAQLVERLG